MEVGVVKYVEPGVYCGRVEGNLVYQELGPVFETRLFGDEDFKVNLNEMTITRIRTGEIHTITSVDDNHINFEPFKFGECSIVMEGG